MPHDPPARIRTLDGLRGIAAVLVVISHLANAGYLPLALGQGLGQIGVCLFFMLSGFLMAQIYLPTPLTGAALRRYGMARVARVLPLYLSVIALSVGLLMTAGTTPYGIADVPTALSSALMLHAPTILWSVPVELQYYLLFVLIWATPPGTRPAMIAALVVVQAALAIALYHAGGSTYVLPFWLQTFLIGHLIATCQTRVASPRLWAAIGWVILIVLPLVPPEVRRGLGLPVPPVFADPVAHLIPALVLVLAVRSAGPFRYLSAPPLVWLGQISFGIYLLHWPLLVWVDALPEAILTRPGAVPLLVLGATLAAATLSWHYLERPAQQALRRKRRQAVIAPSTVSTAPFT